MDKKKHIQYLKELVKFRVDEYRSLCEFNNFTLSDSDAYLASTKEIQDLIAWYESDDKNKACCSSSIMTLDDAILHAKDIAKCDDSICSKNHLQLAEWLLELKDLKVQHAYLAADFDNYRKRMAKNEQISKDKESERLLLHFFRVYDNLELLIENLDNKDVGINVVFKSLEQMLNEQGCLKIECKKGDKFDVSIMEALFTREIKEDEEFKPGEVVEICQSGWKFNEKVIRPVKVAVGKEK